MFKNYIQSRLEKYVKKYFIKHPEVKLVVVVGSVGKTSTKVAIGTVLNQRYRIRLHDGNHNSELSAPLAILGVEYPSNIRSLRQWLAVFAAARKRIRRESDVDIIVQELGTDAPGQIPHFGTYLNPDIAVVTAVSPEHMEFFGTLDAVATEELSAANFSKLALINRDDVSGQFAPLLANAQVNTYGTTDSAEYRFSTEDYTFEDGFSGLFVAPEWEEPTQVTLRLVGEHSTRAAVVAGAVGIKMGMTEAEVASGLEKIAAVKGRMKLLKGFKDSILIDDSYNSSPLAVASALRALYQMNVPQRIAVLGSMNELGDISAKEHETVGKMCDSLQLAHVITVGEMAEKYLAPAARANGCHVVSVKSPLEAGALVNKYLEEGAAILFKGSEGNVYLEEAVKMTLLSTEDDVNLVRQTPAWMERKQKFFDSLTPSE